MKVGNEEVFLKHEDIPTMKRLSQDAMQKTYWTGFEMLLVLEALEQAQAEIAELKTFRWRAEEE